MASLACGGEGGLDVVCWRWGLCLMAHASGLGVDELLTYDKHGQTSTKGRPCPIHTPLWLALGPLPHASI